LQSDHVFVKSICQGMGLTVLSEVPGAVGRLDMAIELSDKIFVIIELKFCPEPMGLTEDETNDALARLAARELPQKETDKILSNKVQEKLGAIGIKRILSEHRQELSNEEIDSLFAKQAAELLTPAQINLELASLARKKFDKNVVKKNLSASPSRLKPTKEQIEAMLSNSVQEALKQIVEKDYHGPFKLQAKEFIDLGLALYGDCLTVKAAFGPR
jgi:hypothetical protein